MARTSIGSKCSPRESAELYPEIPVGFLSMTIKTPGSAVIPTGGLFRLERVPSECEA
jgi:hypothetical protein